jgi:putative addiction module component (TIGR02574 family)
MDANAQAILQAALALPEDARLNLAHELLDSLPPELDELSDEELLAELKRRSAQIDEGTVKLVPYGQEGSRLSQ